MAGGDNDRETGARHFPPKTDADASSQFSQEATENRKPDSGEGLTEALDDVNEKTRHSDGQNPPAKSNSDARQTSGAGPAIAERSKDAKSNAPGREPRAY